MENPTPEQTVEKMENVLFSDIFRRADKNDDGKISFEEFTSYFGDNILSDIQLKDLFDSIDSNKNRNIEVEELIVHFEKGFEPYSPLFSMLEDGNKAVNEVLSTLSKVYTSQSSTEQHKIRFYLQEFLHQIEMLHKAIQRALKTIKKSSPSHHQNNHKSYPSIGREFLTVSEVNKLERNKISDVTTKLENAKIALNLEEQLEPDDSAFEGCTVVSREHHVNVEMVDSYVDATREYLRDTRQEEGCFYVYVKKNTSKQKYELYEIWMSNEALMAHYQKPHYKEHAKAIIDFLIVPEKQAQLVIPAKWLQKGQDE